MATRRIGGGGLTGAVLLASGCAVGTSEPVLKEGSPTDIDIAPQTVADEGGVAADANTSCDPGQRVTASAAGASDRQCEPCPPGSFSSTANAAECAPWRRCGEGEVVMAEGTAMSDTVCADAGDCGAGQYELAAPTPTQPRSCEPCPEGTFNDSGVNVPECQPFSECEAGTREAAAGSATTDRRCEEIDACVEADLEGDGNPCNNDGDTLATCTPDSGGAVYQCTCGAGWGLVDGRCMPPNCSAIVARNPDAADGPYLIAPSGDSRPRDPMMAQCDMTTEGGGWTLVLNYVHASGTNPSLAVRTDDLPLLGTGILGDDESGTASWGHASNSLFQGLGGNELRFQARTSAHPHVMDFVSTDRGCLQYFGTGSGNCRGLLNRHRELAEHSARMPDSIDSGWEDRGERAMTAFPFYRGATHHWGIGEEGRWEADNYPDGVFNTMHRIWTRTKPVFANCQQAAASDFASPAGAYLLDPDSADGIGAVEVLCEEDGWMSLSSVEDFERGWAVGWSSAAVDQDSSCHNVFGNALGGYRRFGSGASTQKVFDFSGVPHREVQLSLDFIVIDSWDDGDAARVFIDGTLVFEQGMGGSATTNQCGAEFTDRGPVQISYLGTHSADTLTLSVSSTVDQGAEDESWAIDNVVVRVR